MTCLLLRPFAKLLGCTRQLRCMYAGVQLHPPPPRRCCREVHGARKRRGGMIPAAWHPGRPAWTLAPLTSCRDRIGSSMAVIEETDDSIAALWLDEVTPRSKGQFACPLMLASCSAHGLRSASATKTTASLATTDHGSRAWSMACGGWVVEVTRFGRAHVTGASLRPHSYSIRESPPQCAVCGRLSGAPRRGALSWTVRGRGRGHGRDAGRVPIPTPTLRQHAAIPDVVRARWPNCAVRSGRTIPANLCTYQSTTTAHRARERRGAQPRAAGGSPFARVGCLGRHPPHCWLRCRSSSAYGRPLLYALPGGWRASAPCT